MVREGFSEEVTFEQRPEEEGTASAKALRFDQAWCVWGTGGRPVWLEWRERRGDEIRERMGGGSSVGFI